MSFLLLLLLLVLVPVALLASYGVVVYNNLVALKHHADKAWSNIDVALRQRHEELPKLVETCKQYMKHERETLEQVMTARAQVSTSLARGDVGELGKAESGLRAGLGQLFAVAESYPDLKANENFQHLQARISGLENTIADRREYYNEGVYIYNIRLEQFPSNLVAQLFSFQSRDLLWFSEEEKADVDLKSLFQQG